MIDVPITGMETAGDPARTGKSELARNIFMRPGRMEGRPGWATTGRATNLAEDGFAIFRDNVNGEDVLCYTGSSEFYAYNKAANTWSVAATGNIRGMKDSTNFQGRLYWMANESAGVPQRYSWDGTRIDADPFRIRIGAESVATFLNRIFFGNTSFYVFNRLLNPYATGGFTPVSSVVSIQNGYTTVTPTGTVGSAIFDGAADTVPANSAEDSTVTWLCQVLNESPNYRMPLTLSLYVSQVIGRSTTYATSGAIRRGEGTGTDYRYRCVVAGTTAGAAPAFSTTVGSITVDGTTQWINEGPIAIAEIETELDTKTENPNPSSFVLQGVIPASAYDTTVGIKIGFGNTSTPTITVNPISIGFRDTYADGDIRKKNFGQQVTRGKFIYPFINKTGSNEATFNYRDRVYFTETDDPKTIEGDNYQVLDEVPGEITVIRTLENFLVCYKERAIWVFSGVGNADNPIRREAVKRGVGCVGTRAIVEFEGNHFFIGDRDFYVFNGSGNPEPLTGAGMREEIFAHGAKWKGSGCVLEVDEANREFWVTTQNDCSYVYNLEVKSWTKHDRNINSSPSVITPYEPQFVAADIYDMAVIDDRIVCAVVGGNISHLSPSAATDGVGTLSSAVVCEYWCPPVELRSPRRELVVESIWIHHMVTSVQTADRFEVSLSFDGGVTWTKYNRPTLDVTTGGKKVTSLPLFQMGENVTMRLRYFGPAGPNYFNFSGIDLWVQVHGDELPRSTPTQGYSSL